MDKDKDYFYILKEAVRSETKIKSSTFIGSLSYAENVEQAKSFISSISTEYKDATHNCWAYITGKNADIFHSSDNGEPSGTAGKPILNTLQKYRLTNTVAVVTRYYGGVKLGVRGLIDAYSESAELAIKSGEIIPLIEMSEYFITTSYDFSEQFKYQVKSFNSEILDIQYSDKVDFIIQIEKSLNYDLENYLKEMSNLGKLSLIT